MLTSPMPITQLAILGRLSAAEWLTHQPKSDVALLLLRVGWKRGEQQNQRQTPRRSSPVAGGLPYDEQNRCNQPSHSDQQSTSSDFP
jgi:hypothetical protein